MVPLMDAVWVALAALAAGLIIGITAMKETERK